MASVQSANKRRKIDDDSRSEASSEYDVLFETPDGDRYNKDVITTEAAVNVENESENNNGNDENENENVKENQDGKETETEDAKMISLLSSWGVFPLYENLTACGIDIGNMRYLESRDLDTILGNDKHLLGHMIKFRYLMRQWNIDDNVGKASKSLTVNVLSILSDSVKGKKILEFHEKHKRLNRELRRELVDVILKYTFSKRMVLPRKILVNIAEQICTIFPKEKQSVYYSKKYKKNPTGILYSKYINMRSSKKKKSSANEIESTDESEIYLNDSHEIESHQSREKESQVSKEMESHVSHEMESEVSHEMESEVSHEMELEVSHESEHHATYGVEEEVVASITFLKKNDYTNPQLIIEHWNNSYEYRQLQEYKTVDDIFDEWPILRNEDGYILLKIDFAKKYAELIHCGVEKKWDNFFGKNLNAMKKMIKDPFSIRDLNSINSTTNPETKNRLMSFALHYMLIPSSTNWNGLTWKPSIPSSKNTFLRLVNGETKMKSEMKRRVAFCKTKNIMIHPLIFEVKNSRGSRYAVGISNVFYFVETLIQAIDIAFKVFKLFRIKFPPESKKVWMFVEHMFYKNIDDDHSDDPITGEVLSIICDLDLN